MNFSLHEITPTEKNGSFLFMKKCFCFSFYHMWCECVYYVHINTNVWVYIYVYTRLRLKDGPWNFPCIKSVKVDKKKKNNNYVIKQKALLCVINDKSIYSFCLYPSFYCCSVLYSVPNITYFLTIMSNCWS